MTGMLFSAHRGLIVFVAVIGENVDDAAAVNRRVDVKCRRVDAMGLDDMAACSCLGSRRKGHTSWRCTSRRRRLLIGRASH